VYAMAISILNLAIILRSALCPLPVGHLRTRCTGHLETQRLDGTINVGGRTALQPGQPSRLPTHPVGHARDKSAVPGEQGRGCHCEYLASPASGISHDSAASHSRSARFPDPADLAEQHGVLVPQHQGLGIFGQLAPRQYHQAVQQTAYKQQADD
jgi:hypothetical protein